MDTLLLKVFWNGTEVEGVLQYPNSKSWRFVSENEAFKKLIPTGILLSRTLWADGGKFELSNRLYEAIIQAAEKEGVTLLFP